MRYLSRVHAYLGIALPVVALVAVATMSAASADTKVRARLDWAAYGLHAPFFVAVEKGWFKEKGLDVSVDDGNGSSKTITLVGAGKYDIGHANLSAMVLAKNKGLPVISVGHIVRRSDVAVLVPKDSGIKTPKDLEGKKVLLTPGGFTDPFFDTFLKAGGTSRDKLTVIGVSSKVKTSTYVAREADAMLSTAPYYLPVLANKLPSNAILFADYGVPLPGFGLVANSDFVKKNPQAVRDFVQVFFKTLAWIYDGNQAETVAIFAKMRPDTKLTEGSVRGTIDSFQAFLSTPSTAGKPLGWHSPSDWKAAIDLIIGAKLIDAASKPTDFYSNDYVMGGGAS